MSGCCEPDGYSDLFGARFSRQLDLAATPDAVEAHDIVVLHRVVCCYPDVQRLLTAAADHATRLLVFSHPPANILSRAVFAAENLLFRVRRTPFRTYVHDPDAMRTAAEHGRLRATRSTSMRTRGSTRCCATTSSSTAAPGWSSGPTAPLLRAEQ